MEYRINLYLRELGLSDNVSEQDIRKAYRRLVKKIHPDLFPKEQRDAQQQRMVRVNHAYKQLLIFCRQGAFPHKKIQGPWKTENVDPLSVMLARKMCEYRMRNPKPGLVVYGDLPYAYYKRGFVAYSKALFGVEALKDKMQREANLNRDALRRFVRGIMYLREAEKSFVRLIDEYPHSIWTHDARMKLRRIGKFFHIYTRIIDNLRRRIDEKAIRPVVSSK